MYKFRSIPLLEGAAAEYFAELQTKMTEQSSHVDTKALAEGWKAIMERTAAHQSHGIH